MKYLQGHLKGAVNLPLAKLFGRPIGSPSRTPLLPVGQLAEVFGATGLDNNISTVVYDSYDGQSGAMLAWVLEYLGCTHAYFMKVFFEAWVAEGREVFYRPVQPRPAQFIARPNPNVRASLEDVRDSLPSSLTKGGHGGIKLLDMRSQAEYAGLEDTGVSRPGHIPGAVNIVWRELLGGEQGLLEPQDRLQQRLAAADIQKGDSVIAYCRMGPRAAVGYLALQQLGYHVRLYDGSYAEWSASDLPVELSSAS
jgi:thiosulfate/3-mercaptopyruvate sulfurtransferase